jgi:hypothetical protein
MATYSITLERETEDRLRAKAASAGLTLEDYLRLLADLDAVKGPPARPRPTFEEVTAPFAKAVAASGMTEEELFEFFTKSVKEVRAEKRARNGTNP